MKDRSWIDVPSKQEEWPHLAIYLINKYQLQGLMTGKTKITNLPEEAEIYKIMIWKPDECDNIMAVWISHPEFRETYPGDLVEIRYLHFE